MVAVVATDITGAQRVASDESICSAYFQKSTNLICGYSYIMKHTISTFVLLIFLSIDSLKSVDILSAYKKAR